MQTVIDTNIWIRRLLGSSSMSAMAADKALKLSDVLVSGPVLDELLEVLMRDDWR